MFSMYNQPADWCYINLLRKLNGTCSLMSTIGVSKLQIPLLFQNDIVLNI